MKILSLLEQLVMQQRKAGLHSSTLNKPCPCEQVVFDDAKANDTWHVMAWDF